MQSFALSNHLCFETPLDLPKIDVIVVNFKLVYHFYEIRVLQLHRSLYRCYPVWVVVSLNTLNI